LSIDLVFALISILFRAEVRALLCLSVLFNILDHVIICCIAICFMFVLANKIIMDISLPVNAGGLFADVSDSLCWRWHDVCWGELDVDGVRRYGQHQLCTRLQNQRSHHGHRPLYQRRTLVTRQRYLSAYVLHPTVANKTITKYFIRIRKVALISTLSNTWFLGPTGVSLANHLTIGSCVFAQTSGVKVKEKVNGI